MGQRHGAKKLLAHLRAVDDDLAVVDRFDCAACNEEFAAVLDINADVIVGRIADSAIPSSPSAKKTIESFGMFCGMTSYLVCRPISCLLWRAMR
jgi:hypothetical protein